MPKKRKTLTDNVQEIIDSGDFEAFKAIFDKCEISATNRGKTTQNIFSYQGLTPKHITFLIENGIDVNADAGWGLSPVAHQSSSLENLQCLIAHGADIDFAVNSVNGNALFHAARHQRNLAVRNLLQCGASPDVNGGYYGNSALDEALSRCGNIDIVNMLDVARQLLHAGVQKTDKSLEYVRKIGEQFEFYRADFNVDYVDEFSDALQELYQLFDVAPVPRRVVHDGTVKIVVTSKTWQEQHTELWDMLVPGKGAASTVQGELIRITGRLTNEILDNGGINWDSEYRKMAKALVAYFHVADGMDRVLVEEACSLAKMISSRSDKGMLYRLTELAVKWVIANPDPITLSNVTYKR